MVAGGKVIRRNKPPAAPGPAPQRPAGCGAVGVLLAYLHALEAWAGRAERYIAARDRGELGVQLALGAGDCAPAAGGEG